MVLIAFYFLKFLATLRKETLRLLIFSGIVFLSGAVGMEMIGGNIASQVSNYQNVISYMICYTIEETLEMLGITLLIYTLLTYIKDYKIDYLKLRIV